MTTKNQEICADPRCEHEESEHGLSMIKEQTECHYRINPKRKFCSCKKFKPKTIGYDYKNSDYNRMEDDKPQSSNIEICKDCNSLTAGRCIKHLSQTRQDFKHPAENNQSPKILTEQRVEMPADTIFIDHIKSHLKDSEDVICKICGKTATEIIRNGK